MSSHFIKSSFIELDNFELEHISISSQINFSSFSLRLETSLVSFGLNILSISSFIEFAFLKNTYHWTRILSSLKFEQKNSASFWVLNNTFKSTILIDAVNISSWFCKHSFRQNFQKTAFFAFFLLIILQHLLATKEPLSEGPPNVNFCLEDH